MKVFFYTLLLLLTLGAAPALAQPRLATAPPPDQSLEFVQNRGQWPASIHYAAAVPGGHLYLETSALRYVLLQPLPHPGEQPATASAPKSSGDAIRGHQLWVRFVGARADAALQPAEATTGRYNYLCGNDPARWAKAAAGYRQVRYQQPWPGVDVRLYENATQHLEYDFELAAGADPSQVQLRYEGATKLSINEAGQLLVGTTVGDLTELHPHAYQPDPAGGAPRAVACAYRLDRESQTVRFALGDYDHTRPLVIDPTVVFSSYTGALGSNWGFTATYDNAGNLYAGGIVLNDGFAVPSFPTTGGAFQTTFGGVIDIAVIKYNPSANGPAARVWATYLGGNQADFPSSLVVNAQNELIVLGSTASTNYPTTRNAVQRTFKGGKQVSPFNSGSLPYNVPSGTDIVVSRLSADGTALAASTYLGGRGNDGIAAYEPANPTRQLPQNYGDAIRGDVLADAQGNIYLASVTASPDFPVAGGFGPTYRGGTSDAVLCKLNPDMTALGWSGYLGGSASDAAYSLQLDAGGNVYAVGGTLSPDLPGTAGAYQSKAQGNVDGFVACIAAHGSTVQRATYLGTSNYDQAFFVQLGSDGGVYLLGQTLGAWPVTAGVYRNVGSRQFISKLSPALDALQVSTVFGSGRNTIDISPTAFLVDQCDRVYACGWGGADNGFKEPIYSYSGFVNTNGYTDGMPTTPNAVRTTPDTPGAGSDFYLAQFSAGLQGLTYATYYGNATPKSEGDHVDGGTSRFDPRGVVYSAACSCFSRDGFPVPPGANTYSAINGAHSNGGSWLCNTAAFKINFEPTVATVGSNQTVCATAAPVPLSGTPAGGVWSGPGVSGSVAAGFVFTPSANLLGPQTLTYTVTGATMVCTVTAQQIITVQPSTRLPATIAQPLGPVCATAAPVALTGATPAGGVWSGPGVSGSVATGFVFTPSASLLGVQTLTYAILASTCTTASKATTTVQVLAALRAVVPPDTVLCPGSTQAFRLRGTPAGGTWSGPGVTPSGLFTPTGVAGTSVLTYTVGAGTSCSSQAVRRITLLAAPVLAPELVPGTCTPTSVAPLLLHYRQDATTLAAGTVLTWHFGDDSTAVTGPDVTHTYQNAGTYRPRVVVSYNQGRCTQVLALPPMVVQPMAVPNVFTPNGDGLNDYFAPRLGGCAPRLQVFTRWGQRVYEDGAYRNTWDGAGLAPGIYYYLITPTDGAAPIKGWVELVRD